MRLHPAASLLAPLLAGLLALAIYWPGLQGDFFFDDRLSILEVEGVHMTALSLESVRQALASGSAGPTGRPVAQLGFALNHLFSGFAPFAFKATNLAIHLACAWLVFVLLRRLLAATQTLPGNPGSAAGLLAAAWLLHPLQLLPVLHVVQRMTSLSALFLLAAFWLHVVGRERGGWRGGALLALAWGALWPLACMSKETGLLFPAFVLAWEWLIRYRLTGRSDRWLRILTWSMAAGLAAGAVYLFLPAGQWLWSNYDFRSFTPDERLLTEARVLWFYLGLALLPRLEAFGLYHDDIALSSGLLTPWTTLPALAGLLLLVVMAWRARRRQPLIAFGIAWFLIGHALESTWLPLEIAHEHRNYLPLFGVLLCLAGGLHGLLAHSGARRTAGLAVAAAALAYLALLTGLRAHQFGDEGLRTQIEAQHHRDSASAQHDAGQMLAAQPDAARPDSPTHAFARSHFEQATALDPGFKMSLLGLVFLDCRAGQPVAPAVIDELASRLEQTPLGPADRNVLHRIKEMSLDGSLCLGRGDVARMFSAAQANPSVLPFVRAMLYSWHADYLTLVARDLPAAQAELDRALAIAPYNQSNRLKRAQLAFLAGRTDEARKLLDALHQPSLSQGEKETLARLRACLGQQDPSIVCVGK